MIERAACLALVLTTAAACEDLDEFKTGPGQVFRGTVVGGGNPDAGLEGSFIRRGFPVGTQLELTFDPTPTESAEIGTITTTDLNAPFPGGVSTFKNSKLERIAPLQHDLLSQYDFPGGGRLRNYIFVARGAPGGCLDTNTLGMGGEREAMVFISLLDEGTIEVRIIAGTGGVFYEGCGPGTAGTGMVDYYGLFTLSPP